MTYDLAKNLPQLLPSAIAWAEGKSAEICRDGVRLTPSGLAVATAVGVHRPDQIRLVLVDRLPLPENADLRIATVQTGLLGPNMVGLTLGYGILICNGHLANRLLSHECRHVYQYEAAGSIASFLLVYLQQIGEFGYARAPLEVDARNHESKFR